MKQGESADVVPIVEVGAGSGRLGYLIVKHLLEIKEMWPNPKVCPFKYV